MFFPHFQLCTGNVCLALDAVDCECSSLEEACDVCCLIDGTCLSTIRIAEENISGLANDLPGNMGRRRSAGSPCANFMGYCDFLFKCVTFGTDGFNDTMNMNDTNVTVTMNTATDGGRGIYWVVIVIAVSIFTMF